MTVHELPGRQVHDRSFELAAMAVDFELTRAESAELETHLAACSTCARRAAAMRGDAVALGRPVLLLPSARVDAAVAAEIAGRRAGGPQRLVLVAAVAMLVLALLGAAAVGAYLLRNSQTAPITEVTRTIASPRPDASPVAIGETWQAIDFDPGSGGSIEAVTSSGADLIGVGRGGCVPDFNNPTDCYGAAWTSAGGAPWVRAADQPGLAVGLEFPTSGPEKGIYDVASGPAGFVAIGRQYAGVGPGIWRSTDGQRWDRVAIGSNVVDDFFVAIAANPQGYVIVGRAVDYQALSARAAVWVSADGETWTRVADSAAMDVGSCLNTGEEPSCGGMRAITWTGSQFVAVGETRTGVDGQSPQLAAWTSHDGTAWARSDQGLGFGDERTNTGGFLSGVTTGGPGIVAVGTVCEPDCNTVSGFAATSRDGSTWTVTRIAGANALIDVVSAGGSTFAVGIEPGSAPPPSIQLWRSDDGVDWQRMSGPPPIVDGTSISGLDAESTGDRLMLVGWASASLAAEDINFAYLSPPAATPSEP